MRALCISARLDLTTPPWQLDVFTRVHQVDWLPADAIVEIARKLFADDVSAPADSASDGGAQPTPGPAALFANAVAGLPAQFWKVVAGTQDVLAASREVRRAAARGDLVPPTWLRPRTRFDHRISGSRTFGVARFSIREIREIRAIKAQTDATLNDLMMTVVSRALSEYLNSLNELPDESLAALVPMSMRNYRPGESVNQFLPMFVELHTQEPDPVQRLHAISESARREKQRVTDDNVIRSLGSVKLVPGFAVRALVAVSAHVPDAGTTTPYANTMITNVPRGPADLHFFGADSTSAFGVLAMENYEGLCHMIASLGDEVTITFVSTPERMPDPDHYSALLNTAFEELSAAIQLP